jgi:hypothetical protein
MKIRKDYMMNKRLMKYAPIKKEEKMLQAKVDLETLNIVQKICEEQKILFKTGVEMALKMFIKEAQRD